MTMVFKAADPPMLTQVKQGDKIKFNADNVNGQFIVTKIEKKKEITSSHSNESISHDDEVHVS